jgi:hypothetical protein
MCVDCVLASSRITQVDPGDEPLPEVVCHTTHRPHTRLQGRIRNSKVYTNGTIRYGCLASTDSEPRSISEALANEQWKSTMDSEFHALLRNKTWHLVPPQ